MRGILICLLLWVGGAAHAATCVDILFKGVSYTTCEVMSDEDLRLFQAGPDGPYGSFSAIKSALEPQGLTLNFAMNGGMFHRDLAPVGLYVEGGSQKNPLITSDGPGNFGLLPNGVFCVGDRFLVVESRSFRAAPPACRFANQSGPMLVIDGALHPKFLPGSDSLNIRNGVGVSDDGLRAIFVISNAEVNFYTFAQMFRDYLGTPNALYFDGSISRLYAPQLDRHDGGFPMGPIVGVVVPRG